ncbi:MAG: sigma-70 family RNA polymerase sigma factor [Fermentimonas sp.]|nr:sigma-70 family RNA polymerase sigma factor [Fermentimonas sp.]
MKTSSYLTNLYILYVNDLFTYGTYLGFEKEVVKDAIHDVFVNISAKNQILDEVSNIKFYLFRSLKNRLYDIQRGNKNQIGLEGIAAEEVKPFQINVNIEDQYIEEEERREIKKEIEEMLNSLTDKQREIIYLKYVQEYDYKQISELLDINIHSCRKLVSKALSNLRKKYGVISILLLIN